MRYKIQILALILCLTQIIWSQNSPLSSGIWYKIQVSETGLHKIDFSMLSSMGFEGKDPKKIKVYGYGGILKQALSEFRYGDLVENPITYIGEEDGIINSSDYLVFYAEGPDDIFPSKNAYLEHEKNPYSRFSYYFVSYDETDGKRITTQNQTSSKQEVLNAIPFIYYYEKDEISVAKSGREWFGESFRYKTSQSFNYFLEDIFTDSTVNYELSYIGGSINFLTYMNTRINGGANIKSTFSLTAKTYGPKGSLANHRGTVKLQSPNVNIRAEFDSQGDGAGEAYLDYYRFVYFRRLYGDKSVSYVIPDSFLGSKLKINNITPLTQVWDVSRVDEIKRLSIENGVVTTSDSTKKLLVLSLGDAKKPTLIGKVNNQNLHQLIVPELLIVTHPSFLASANAYKKFKEERQGIETAVVSVFDIYNEYSSGRQDVSAIRDFVRDLYNRDNKIHYLLLFGDCSYDYLDRLSNNTNFVPVYQSRSSLNNVTSFSSDDYFGFLEDKDGFWSEDENGTEDLEIGIGRLPIKSDQEGYIALEKLRSYLFNKNSEGNWRNKVVFVADDGDSNTHTNSSNDLSIHLQKKVADFNMNKVFLDAYPQVSTSVGQLAPVVNEELLLKINKGALIVNYSGHGSEVQWAQENIFNTGMINTLQNKDKLPFFITATCEFGRYDDPVLESGAERLLFNSNGGAIALMTTTRPVYESSNKVINLSFYTNAFIKNSESKYDYLGEVLRRTKNQSIISFYNRNFSLLGDPTVRLAFPDYSVKVDSLNGVISTEIDTIRALQKVMVTGHIEDRNKVLDTSFNGTLIMTVFDKETDVFTLGNESNPYQFYERSSLVFEGEVFVVNGKYTAEFVVPKDISYSFGKGKFSFYAVNDKGVDATGSFYDFYIGGGVDGFDDNFAPKVRLFANDTTFVSGGITSKDPIFIASIFDENGINTTNTGIGHEMTLVIDDNQSKTYVLNDYHKSVGNSYQNGWVEYPLYNLSEGMHKLTFKVWDVNNNSTEQDLYVNVSDKGIIQVYPNPFYDEVKIHIEQPRQDIRGEISLKIFNLYGLEIWSQIFDFESFTSVVDTITWNGQTISGENLDEGIYILVSELRYEDNVSNVTEKTKLILQK